MFAGKGGSMWGHGAVSPSLAGNLVPMTPGQHEDEEGAQPRSPGLGMRGQDSTHGYRV